MDPSPSRLCFVLSPIGDEGSPTRERSDTVFNYIIAPVCRDCGFAPERADHIPQSGLITTQVVQRIIEAPLVIADLTEYNANVFYELAIRHATRKPFLQIIGKDHKVPFDVAGLRTIVVNHEHLPSVEKAKNQIREQIEAFGDMTSEVETPISQAFDLSALQRTSPNPVQKAVADMLVMLSDIRNEVSALQSTRVGSDITGHATVEDLRSLMTTILARMSGVADPSLLSTLVDATQLLTRAKHRAGRGNGAALVEQAERVLRQLTVKLMSGSSTDVESPARQSIRSKQHIHATREKQRARKK